MSEWFRGFRKLLRATHRDAGYLAVGLTIIYALSGLAVNHIGDWDPNFEQVKETRKFDPLEQRAVPGTSPHNDLLARRALYAIGVRELPRAVYAPSGHELDITLEQADVHLDIEAGIAHYEGQQERFLLRTANFLHLNRGKKAWTYVADGYAVLLLTLAVSGMFMIKGKRGLWGRGAVLVLIGASVPAVYVLMSGK